jgi:hypothetical protein
MNDPLEEMLRPTSHEESYTALRQELLGRTLALVPSHRSRRMLAVAASLAACFLLGMLAMGLLRVFGAAREAPAVADGEPPPKALPPPAAPPKRVSNPSTALTKEWEAFDSKDRRVERFVRAGNQYLQEQEDIGSALRCYRQAVAAAAPADLVVQPEDNWLVMALKTARRKELEDAPQRR